jgi:hypothetical protein
VPGDGPSGLAVWLEGEAVRAQRFVHRPGGGPDRVFPVGEQVQVQGGSADDAVGEQSTAAAEREPVPGRCPQGDRGDAAVHRVEPVQRSV